MSRPLRPLTVSGSFLVCRIFLFLLLRTTHSATMTTTNPATETTTTVTTTAIRTTTATVTTAMRVDVLSSLSPGHGPVAGGTKVICKGQRLSEIIDVYFGEVVGQRTVVNTPADSLTVYSPAAHQTGSVAIILKLRSNGGEFFVKTNLTFNYRPNPNIINIYCAPVQLTSGGSLLTVVGSSLDSVADPLVNVTVVLKQPPQRDVWNSYTKSCTRNETSQTLNCILPDLQLSEDFTKKLQADKQESRVFSTPETGCVAMLHGPGFSELRVYLGLVFDGYRGYENVSDPNSAYKQQMNLNFTPPPIINSSTEVLAFDTKKDTNIRIEGDLLEDACNYGVLCEIFVGDGRCNITDITDTVITCVPPKEKPHQSANDSFCRPHHPDSLTILVHVGFRSYNYKCFHYYSLNVGLIVGLVVGLGLPVISIALCLSIRRLRSDKPTPPPQLPPLDEIDTPDPSSIEMDTHSSNRTNPGRNRKQISIYQNLRSSILKLSNKNVYSPENPNRTVESRRKQHGGDHETDDVAERHLNIDRGNFHPTGNEIYSNVEGGNGGAVGEQSCAAGELRVPTRQSVYPPSAGSSRGNSDANRSANGYESEDTQIYANT